MENKKKFGIISLFLLTALSVTMTGCGEKRVVETEPQTEVLTEKITETEPPTEKETEPPTEKITETETETEEDRELTPEEEAASEQELKGNKIMYAADDINIRQEPSTEADIISSYDQGEQVTVSAETKNWYKVVKDGYSGYVRKDGLSEEEVEPKSAEERARILEEQGYANLASGVSSSTDLEYGVQTYAESFSIVLAADANVRSLPSEEGDILATVESGTHMTAVGETNSWYKVQYDGVTGFVHKNLVG